MINPNRSFNIHYYVDIFLRRIWYFVIPLTLVFAGFVVYAFMCPKQYRASTLILVTPQKVPEAFVKTTITSSIEDRLQSIAQEILSRTRLEQIINEFKLYPKEAKSLTKEELVELMRKNINVEIKGSASKSRNNSNEGHFTISYVGEIPEVVTLVTNRLASLFIEENLKNREQQAQDTVKFIATELEASKAKLDEQEKLITGFKRSNINELPDQRDANLKVLEQFQLQLTRINENLSKAEDRKIILQNILTKKPGQNIIGGLPEELTDNETPAASYSVQGDLNEKQLIKLTAQLEDLKAKYTEKHPDLIITKRKIADLEKKIAETPKSGPGMESDKGKRLVDPVTRQANMMMEERRNQLMATDLEIKKLKKEDERIKAMINEYQSRIERTPVRELALTSLSRDYKNIYETYQTLLKKKVDSEQAENLERRQKGEQFKIIDPARIPEKPFKPDIPNLILMGIALGIGSGLVGVFVREQMDRSFRDAEDVYATLELKVLANIPKIENAKRHNRLEKGYV
jgi:polysaccharide chain length determinant protein (PEP-CTERM system associated)